MEKRPGKDEAGNREGRQQNADQGLVLSPSQTIAERTEGNTGNGIGYGLKEKDHADLTGVETSVVGQKRQIAEKDTANDVRPEGHQPTSNQRSVREHPYGIRAPRFIRF